MTELPIRSLDGAEGPVQVHTDDGVDVSEALLVVGIPTLGLVGTITAQYLVDQLEMERIGGVYSPRFPPVGRVFEGRSSYPVRLHALETPCGPQLGCERLIVAVTEFVPGPSSLYGLTESLTRWGSDNEVELILIPDGLLVEGKEGPTLHAIGSHADTLDRFEDHGLQRLDQGLLFGFSAAMLTQADRFGIDTISVLAESAPGRPDARAASRLVELLDGFVPKIHIETEPLLEEAKGIERRVRELREQMESQAEQHEPTPYDQMYT